MSETQTTAGPVDLVAIKEALAAATPGPWVADGQDFTPAGYHGTVYLYSPTAGQPVLSASLPWEDARLISMAPQWLAQLVAENERLRAGYAAATTALAKVEAERDALRDALIWTTGSPDFGHGGEAHLGWLRVVAPVLGTPGCAACDNTTAPAGEGVE